MAPMSSIGVRSRRRRRPRISRLAAGSGGSARSRREPRRCNTAGKFVRPRQLQPRVTRGRIATAATAGALLVVVVVAGLSLSSRDHRSVSSSGAGNTRSLASPSPTSQFHGVQATMPSCSSGALFSVSPIAIDKITYIVPLGGPNPLPGEHVYFIIIRGGPNNSGPTQIVNLYAPGDLTAFRIGRQEQTTNGETGNLDYYVYFTPCREVTVPFAHVSSLTGPLGGIAFDTCAQPYSIGDGSLYEHCTAEINIPLRAGELIGTAGGGAAA